MAVLDQSMSQGPRVKAQSRSQPGRLGVRWWVPWSFITPNVLGLLVFTMVPLVAGLLIAFTKWNVVSGPSGIRWVGVQNFVTLAQDHTFWAALGRTGIYAGISVPCSVLLSLGLAMALNRPIPGRAVLRVIFFLPAVVNVTAIGMVWLLLLNPQSGLVDIGLRFLGWDGAPGWFVSTQWALPGLIMIAIWSGLGYHAVIYLAALQDLPHDLYEAAMMDGANAWRRFRVVTWPALVPTTTFLGITSFIGYSQGFGLIAFVTQGGPGSSTTVLSYYMYQNGFQYYRFGYAAAMGIISFVGVLVLTVVMWRLQRERGLYS